MECCSVNISKKNSSPQEIKAKFLEHDRELTKDFKIFTDGSKSNEGTGCAIIMRDQHKVGRLPNAASSFTAEITALVHALKEASKINASKFVIYTDSKSAIDAICKYNPFQPLVQKAQEWLYLIYARHKSVRFCWVPSHVGIRGNEVADAEAKSACALPRVDLPELLHSDMYHSIKSFIRQKWQTRWSSPELLNNRKYKAIRPNISFWPSCYQKSRRDEIVLSRLRIGHSHLTHKFLLEGSDAPVCDHCRIPLSVDHILVHCRHYNAARRKHGLAGKPVTSILDNDADIIAVINFLKEINLYNKI